MAKEAVEEEIRAALHSNWEACDKKKNKPLYLYTDDVKKAMPKLNKEGNLKELLVIDEKTGVPSGGKSAKKIPKKINGISFGIGGREFNDRISFARQDHNLCVYDCAKKALVACVKAPWTQCMATYQNKVVSGGMDNAVTVWDIEGGLLKEKKKIIEHDGYISTLVFAKDGSKYFSAGGDGDSRLVDLNKLTTVTRFCGHEKDALSLNFARDDEGQKLFATCSSDLTIKLWDVTSGKCVADLNGKKKVGDYPTYVRKGLSAPVEAYNTCAMFPMEKSYVAAGGVGDFVYLFDIRTQSLVAAYRRENQDVTSLAWSQSGRALYAGQDDGSVIVWDIYQSEHNENRKYTEKIMAHVAKDKAGNIDKTQSVVQTLKVSDSGVLASGGFDSKVILWSKAPAA